MEKKNAARKAANQYSADRREAVKAYATLTNRASQIVSEEGYNLMLEEMLLLLPPYRHPLASYSGEYQTFVDIDCMGFSGTGYIHPLFLGRLKQSNIDDDLLAEIKVYVEESELRAISLNNYREEADRLREMISNARQVYYDNREKRSDQRNALVVQILGLSEGVPTVRIDKQQMYSEYMKLVRHQGFSRKEATEILQKKHHIQSFDATLKHLHSCRQSLLKRWKQEHPTLLPKIESYLEAYILSRR